MILSGIAFKQVCIGLQGLVVCKITSEFFSKFFSLLDRTTTPPLPRGTGIASYSLDILGLCSDPYRLGVGDYEVIVDIDQEELIILVLRMGHRKVFIIRKSVNCPQGSFIEILIASIKTIMGRLCTGGQYNLLMKFEI